MEIGQEVTYMDDTYKGTFKVISLDFTTYWLKKIDTDYIIYYKIKPEEVKPSYGSS